MAEAGGPLLRALLAGIVIGIVGVVIGSLLQSTVMIAVGALLVFLSLGILVG